MSEVYRLIDGISSGEAARMEKGEGYDLLAREAYLVNEDLEKKESVDILKYSHGNFSVSMVGVYTENLQQKRRETESWMDAFLDSGFSTVSRTLRSPDLDSEDKLADEPREKDYVLFRAGLDQEKKAEIKDSLRGVVDWSRMEEHERLEPADLK